jgi:hypothetical protein
LQKLFAASPARLVQQLGRGKSDDKGLSTPMDPVIERFQCCWIIHVQRLLELIDQRGALLNERDLIAAE